MREKHGVCKDFTALGLCYVQVVTILVQCGLTHVLLNKNGELLMSQTLSSKGSFWTLNQFKTVSFTRTFLGGINTIS